MAMKIEHLFLKSNKSKEHRVKDEWLSFAGIGVNCQWRGQNLPSSTEFFPSSSRLLGNPAGDLLQLDIASYLIDSNRVEMSLENYLWRWKLNWMYWITVSSMSRWVGQFPEGWCSHLFFLVWLPDTANNSLKGLIFEFVKWVISWKIPWESNRIVFFPTYRWVVASWNEDLWVEEMETDCEGRCVGWVVGAGRGGTPVHNNIQ